MSAAVTITAVGENADARLHPFRAATLGGSGLTASSQYLLQVVDPVGGTTNDAIKTDGTGGFTFPYVPQDVGTLTVNVFLLTGTTFIPIANASTALLPAANATATATVYHGDM